MIPTMRGRIEMFLQVLPLHLLELSHVLGSVSGVLLILLARSLYRRHDAAFRITQLLLGLGMIFSLLKGFDWESALLLGLFLLIITPCRSLFYRKGSLLHAQFTPGWLISVGPCCWGRSGCCSSPTVRWSMTTPSGSTSRPMAQPPAGCGPWAAWWPCWPWSG